MLAFTVFIIDLLTINILLAQSWNFVKEKEGIKVFTRHEPNSNLKAFKGEATLNVPIGKVSELFCNNSNFDWWDKNITQIKVLDSEENKYYQFYLVYSLPWPLADRDFAVDVRMKCDSATGILTVNSKPLLNVVPLKPDLVRITKYWQKWTIQPVDKSHVHAILEGFIDPGGNVPSWLYNIIVPQAPVKSILSLQKYSLSGKKALTKN
jgi:hypothetical protein